MVAPQVSGLGPDERRTVVLLARRVDELQSALDVLTGVVEDHEARITVLEP